MIISPFFKNTKYIFLLLFILFLTQVKSQLNCGFDEVRNNLLNDLNYKSIDEEKEQKIQKVIHEFYGADFDETKEKKIYIPVVFHILNHNNLESISKDYKFYSDLLANVNDYFNGNHAKNSNLGNVSQNAVDTKIQFIFAVDDPNGKPTNGVNHIDASNIIGFENDGINNETNMKIIFESFSWTPEEYLNIFVAHKTINNGVDRAGFANFGPLPSPEYAVYVRHDPLENMSDMVPHEIGHMFGLYHTFTGDNVINVDGVYACPANDDPYTQGDKVPDTQPHIRNALPYSGIFNSRLNINDCVGNDFSPSTAYNIMSYYNDYFLFTQEQKKRMRAVVEINKNYNRFENGTNEIESGRAFTRIVSDDRRCEASFYSNQFKIRKYDNLNENNFIWNSSNSIVQGDQNFIATVDEYAILRIKAFNNGFFNNRWISNTSGCRETGVSKIRLENKGTFHEPECNLFIFRNINDQIWNQSIGGISVDADKINKDPSIFIKDKRFIYQPKYYLENAEELVHYYDITNFNQHNYLISPDKTKVLIKNGLKIELLQQEKNCPNEYLNTINVLTLD